MLLFKQCKAVWTVLLTSKSVNSVSSVYCGGTSISDGIFEEGIWTEFLSCGSISFIALIFGWVWQIWSLGTQTKSYDQIGIRKLQLQSNLYVGL